MAAATTLLAHCLPEAPTELEFSTIIVVVGADPNVRRFAFPKLVLCRSSAFFAKALSEAWKEGVEQKVELPEVEPETFVYYAGWLYGLCNLRYQEKSVTEEKDKNIQENRYYRLLIKAYMLGEELADCDFMDMVLDAFAETYKRVGTMSYININTVFSNTLPDSQLRRFMVNWWVYAATPDDLKKWHPKPAPMDFLQELSLAMLEYVADPNHLPRTDAGWLQSLASRCKFHAHIKEGKPCYRVPQRNPSKK